MRRWVRLRWCRPIRRLACVPPRLFRFATRACGRWSPFFFAPDPTPTQPTLIQQAGARRACIRAVELPSALGPAPLFSPHPTCNPSASTTQAGVRHACIWAVESSPPLADLARRVVGANRHWIAPVKMVLLFLFLLVIPRSSSKRHRLQRRHQGEDIKAIVITNPLQNVAGG